MVFWEGLVVICVWQSHQAVLPGIGMYLDVGLEGRLRLSCGQHSFKSLLSLILPYFASPLLQTHFCGKSSFIPVQPLLVLLDQSLCPISPLIPPPPAGVNDRGGAPDCTDGCEPAPALPR